MTKQISFQQLYTPEGASLGDHPHDRYPRPQLVRKDWLSLNGTFRFGFEGCPETDIRVPFCPESLLSGYKGEVPYGAKMRYKKEFEVPEEWRSRRIILHFGAVSRLCEVFINGKKVIEHDNGYLPFEVDITNELNTSDSKLNLLEVHVINDLDPAFPTGKQSKKRGGMWYTPVSGIWQSVWLEPVPEKYVRRIVISTDPEGADISAEGADTGIILCEGKEYALKDGKARIEPDEKKYWSPESPYLYRFTLSCGEDTIESYFALRTLEIKDCDGVKRLCLNGRPYFFHGLLDQGYFSDGLYTPADLSLYEKDILAMKALGFNTLRKHIKIEPEQFYYDCDRLGMVVFQDMVNNGVYSFFKDTLLPTIGLVHRNDRVSHRNKFARRTFNEAMEKTVELLRNHPCICYWTIFNEGWGQFDADSAYDRLKKLDGSRFTDSTSGWFHRKNSDVDSIHIYFKKLHPGKRTDLPLVISEFGGYVYKIPEHSFNLEKTYGYRIFADKDAFKQAIRDLYRLEVLPLVQKGLSTAIYTQVSDVEDETNGLLTYDRQVCKLAPEDFRDISDMLYKASAGMIPEQN
ncbi:MAG: glycoside hydrolase family 2 [Lachnospiraceae bacterium]|nr:glycoside hydrolase family 2 [Lachnospiraceae bacterium]